MMGTDLDGRGPTKAAIGGARKQDHRFVDAKLRPSDIEFAGVLAVGVIGGNARLVLEWDPFLRRVGDHGVVLLVPGGAGVSGTANENSIARGAASPIVF